MSQLPFPSPPSRRKSSAEAPWTVTDLAARIKGALVQGLPTRVRVIGEISNFSQRTHWFFSLKDAGCSIRCVCFASSARRIRFPVEDGLQVVASGRVDFYDAQGQVQLYVDAMEPVGQGELEMRFRALCDELRQLGYFDPERKKPLPAMAQRIAVVTSAQGAALQDVIDTAHRRWSGCELILVDVQVQGQHAAPRIAEVIRRLSKIGPSLGIDAILLTRGGGSIEDLWAFNERAVAEAIAQCRLPLVAAIGHETDTTIAELVADARAATPTQAAMLLVPDAGALRRQVTHVAQRLRLLVQRQSQMAQHRLDAAARHPLLRRPHEPVERADREVRRLAARLREALPRRLESDTHRIASLGKRPGLASPMRLVELAKTKLDAASRRLESVGPNQVLRRGYSYTMDAQGLVIRRPGQVSPGSSITTVLAEGRLRSVVQPEEQTPPPVVIASVSPKPPRHRPKSRPSRGEEPNLFADAHDSLKAGDQEGSGTP
ncbi:MAG: exodeoxyribonuclease VII large subunit [Phycisphaeraceae bacterium]|nr:exodeoxyribonuclease VII large subunit [Phycisphaeraceae bacterium]